MNEQPRGAVALLAVGLLVALAFMPATASSPQPATASAPSITLLGDGSTADTGPQPGRPPVTRLKPGERPPQFVVFSFDDADGAVISHVRAAAKESDARVTFFLRGIDLLPAAKRSQYEPPQHEAGAATVPFPTDQQIRATLQQLGQAWLDGHEIADGFIGQFCGPKGARDWSTGDWESEIDQGYSLVNFWKTGTGFTDLAPLPFDYQTELTGGRAPCLEGQQNLIPAEKNFGWRYDSSSADDTQRWPGQLNGLWNFPLQRTDQTRDTYLRAFDHVYTGNRAPLVIGAHPGSLQAAEDTMKVLCRREAVRCVSFRELADWLDTQDPAVLNQLR